MRFLRLIFLITLILFLVNDSIQAQKRRNQIEIYGGGAFPLSPDEFKDFFKIGLSINVQYVIFPSNRLGIPLFAGFEGFTTDSDAINKSLRSNVLGDYFDPSTGEYLYTVTDASLDVNGSANGFKIGAGIRPYLSPVESPVQLFVFGSAIYNAINEKEEIKGGSVTATDNFGNTETINLQPEDFPQSKFEQDIRRFGLALGGGIELPAGQKFNLILQGLFNIIFTSDEPTSFIGFTAGLVF
ncbi:MAG: hypothetical protein D6813_03395 [Calditrichaeota bacterium]|nr:MAG: hypothetical protein D6813_03395 [Calditrichota bacterium]